MDDRLGIPASCSMKAVGVHLRISKMEAHPSKKVVLSWKLLGSVSVLASAKHIAERMNFGTVINNKGWPVYPCVRTVKPPNVVIFNISLSRVCGR